MTFRTRLIVKAVIAVIFGVPGTILFLPIIAFGFVRAFPTGLRALNVGSYLESINAFGLFLWALAGLTGLIGFWAWVFVPRHLSSLARRLIAACVLTGVLAVVPVIVSFGDVHAAIGLAGCGVGIIVCLWLLWPGLPFNPDAQGNSLQNA